MTKKALKDLMARSDAADLRYHELREKHDALPEKARRAAATKLEKARELSNELKRQCMVQS